MKLYVSNDMVKISYEKIIDDNEIIKTDGGKKKLNVYEIQQEMKRRLK